MITCVYFSTFRDGLGSDYTSYQYYCEEQRYLDNIWLLTEPFSELLYSICFHTKLSAILFFLISSSIICITSLWVYSKYKNFYLAAFLFLTYTNLFLSSLNLVRQFVAASIVLYGTHYFVIKKKSIFFFLFVFLAFLWHKSAILCIPIFFIQRNEIKSSLWIVIVLISWFIPVDQLFNIPIIGNVIQILNYADYVSYSEASYSRTSVVNFYIHFILLVCLMLKNKVRQEERSSFVIALKLSIVSVIFCNISANSFPFAYRFGIFFSIFLPILFTYLPTIINKDTARVIVFVPVFALLITVLSGKMNDRVFCPQRILPIESIFDENYHPYTNSESSIFR